jgi:hypothetical protein
MCSKLELSIETKEESFEGKSDSGTIQTINIKVCQPKAYALKFFPFHSLHSFSTRPSTTSMGFKD